MLVKGDIKAVFVNTVSKVDGFDLDQTEVIYSHLKDLKLPKIISELHESKETELIFKKVLLVNMDRCAYINHYLISEKEIKNNYSLALTRFRQLLKKNTLQTNYRL